MITAQTLKRPISLYVVYFFYLLAFTGTILLYINLYQTAQHDRPFYLKWTRIMIGLNLIPFMGATAMLFRRRFGLWLFLIGKVLFFTVPTMFGVIDSVMGLLTPVFFLGSGLFFILFGIHEKHFKRS